MEVCKICNKQMKAITWKHLKYKHNMTILKYDETYGYQRHGVAVTTPEIAKKTSKTKKAKKYIPWNKGLTKETNASIMKYSLSRMGENNPVHKIKDKELWKKHIVENSQKTYESMRGKTYEERFGKEKASSLKRELSIQYKIRTKNRPLHHTPHSEETKNKLREITARRISRIKDKISKPQQKLFNALKDSALNSLDLMLEYQVGFYCIDIAIPSLKICIETDGDFWHCNEAKGFFEKFAVQKRNKINEKRKTTYLLNKNWNIIRIWESDINENIETAIEKVITFVKEKQCKTI